MTNKNTSLLNIYYFVTREKFNPWIKESFLRSFSHLHNILTTVGSLNAISSTMQYRNPNHFTLRNILGKS